MKLRYSFALTGAMITLAYVQDYRGKYLDTLDQMLVLRRSVNKLQHEYSVELVHAEKYTSPVKSVVKLSSPFGYRVLNSQNIGGERASEHMGLDIVGEWHCEIRPIALDGVVIDKWYPPGGKYKGHPLFGGYVRIEHSDGWISGYGHMSTIYVKEGDILKGGKFYRNGKLIGSVDVIGRQGNTGMSTGEHLHLSIQKPDGEFVDPLLYIKLGGKNEVGN